VINRVQKLRKKAGLLATDAVDVYIGASEGAQASTSGRDAAILRVLSSQVCTDLCHMLCASVGQ
jgi:hypothetical protein